ncbi:receptor-like protein kinase HSL1 [Phalaenopsis equestris]|uniref:receptor-like protein kinase HSL1 n=1 Tax=Phalaenopsis equestris TaxID=78828 RepID=UPI0009E230DB|nr:receptor-like protein kinase HSL1 [Phalaenopsis equestris]XP_020598838.1 receptor-like protein kinase HSL1 [Phalaenopsis equestris]
MTTTTPAAFFSIPPLPFSRFFSPVQPELGEREIPKQSSRTFLQMGRQLGLIAAATLLFIHLFPMALTLNQEGLYLLQAKRGLDDPNNALADWNPRDTSPCNWTGVHCSISGDVTAVDLTYFNLTGPFPSTLCRLPNLSFLSLSSNYINSTLLSSSLLPCRSLSHLDLSQNNLIGPLPSLLPSLPLLRYLDLAANNFSGPIPPSFAFFPSLEVLSLTYNLLNGTIPSFLGNLSSLRQLNLSYNPFAAGPIPVSLSNLTNLDTLWLSSCSLTGEIPPALGGLHKLTNLDLSTNLLTGGIPETLSSLSSVVQIELYNNHLTGRFPLGLSNLTALRRIDFSVNNLSGPIPADIFSVTNLESLHLFQNQFTGSVPLNTARARNLLDLRLFANKLSGTLSADLGSYSPLKYLDLSNNQLSGRIPGGLCDGGSLLQLLLINNKFSGSIPTGLGQCRSLYRVRLTGNQLSGDVPAGMWGLPHVWILELRNNSFTGSISRDIANAANLSKLLIDMNQFSGEIPVEIGSLNKLFEFSASNNLLSGPLPESLVKLTELGQLDLHNNLLTGKLLTGIQSWKKLTLINLANNNLTGGIPLELGSLPVLNYLDLSGNDFTGEIPLQLQNLKLNRFNLSDNQLSGPIPALFDSESYKTSFLGNPGLCWYRAGHCGSSNNSSRSRIKVLWLLRAIFIFAAVILIVGIAWFGNKYRLIKKAKKVQGKSKWTLTSFHKLTFSEYEILESLDEDNVIGSGASGKVYKVVLVNGEAVAVKKLWRTLKKSDGNHDQAADEAFEAEVATLGKIRHKNIVKLLCCCAHKDCKLLVYEYMQNGSLGDLLHSCKASVLEWPTRYKIALNAAEGLCYLHHDCVPPIVHRDVKSNNILLDAEFGAKVADFGVAKIVEEVEMGQRSMSFIAGSCGYIAPEYAYTLRVNEKSDIYSFGVVILELVTGKLPVDPEFGEKDLVKWVCSTIQNKGEEHVIDSKLDLSYKKEITKVLHIGLCCTSTLPINRPTMRKVIKMLLDAGKPESSSREGKLSPYFYGDE